MIPYFSTLDCPVDVIVLCLVLAWFISMCVLCRMFCADRTFTKLEMVLIVVVPITAGMFLLWILVGDSTEWSRPIGAWLRGK